MEHTVICHRCYKNIVDGEPMLHWECFYKAQSTGVGDRIELKEPNAAHGLGMFQGPAFTGKDD